MSINKIILLCLLAFAACKKIPEGFLSEGVYYSDSPIMLELGTANQKTASLTLDGSTVPATVTLLDIRHAGTDKRAEEFFREYPVIIYKEAIDPLIDTTIEQVNKKRELTKRKPFDFLPSGQFVFNGGTDSLPADQDYEFDVQVSNVAGVRTFKKIGRIHTLQVPRYEIISQANSWFQDFSEKSGDIALPNTTITLVSDTGNIAILKITDEDGVPFNPAKGQILVRGDRPSFESFSRFHPVKFTDTAMICNFEIAPFPIAPSKQYNNYLIYYRIPSKYVAIDPSVGLDPALTYSVNPRFAFRLKRSGTYIIEVRLPKVKRKI